MCSASKLMLSNFSVSSVNACTSTLVELWWLCGMAKSIGACKSLPVFNCSEHTDSYDISKRNNIRP